MSKVVVVGASGFVGSQVCEALERRGVEVIRAAAPRLIEPRLAAVGEAEAGGFVEEQDLASAANAALLQAWAGADALVNAAGDPDASSRDAGALFAAIAALLPWQQLAPNLAAGVCVLLAFWWFAGSSVALTLIDLDTKRLPDVIVLPGYLVGIVLLTLACLLGADWWALLRAGIGAALLFGLYALLWLVRPGAMGMGDVKLAGLVGLHLGWLGWAAVAVGAIAAFILGGLYGFSLLAARRAGRKTALAFGPWMIAGAWTGALAGAAIAQFYLTLSGLA